MHLFTERMRFCHSFSLPQRIVRLFFFSLHPYFQSTTQDPPLLFFFFALRIQLEQGIPFVFICAHSTVQLKTHLDGVSRKSRNAAGSDDDSCQWNIDFDLSISPATSDWLNSMTRVAKSSPRSGSSEKWGNKTKSPNHRARCSHICEANIFSVTETHTCTGY